MENPYSAPQTPLTTAEIATIEDSEGRNEFAGIDAPTLKRMLRRSEWIRTMGIVFGFVGLAIFGIVAVESPLIAASIFSLEWRFAGYVVYGLLCVGGSYGILARNRYGWFCGLFLTGSALLIAIYAIAIAFRHTTETVFYSITGIVIYFTIITVAGYRAFLSSRELFGPDRITHAALVQELAARKGV